MNEANSTAVAVKELWAIEDAAQEVGVTRQRLNSLLRARKYPSIEVPYRPPREDAAGHDRNVRYRILTGDVVAKIKVERAEAAEKQREMVARAAVRRSEEQPKRRPRRR